MAVLNLRQKRSEVHIKIQGVIHESYEYREHYTLNNTIQSFSAKGPHSSKVTRVCNMLSVFVRQRKVSYETVHIVSSSIQIYKWSV